MNSLKGSYSVNASSSVNSIQDVANNPYCVALQATGTNNTDTLHYKIKDSTTDVDVHNMEVHLWVYRCAEVNISFENIASRSPYRNWVATQKTYSHAHAIFALCREGSSS